MKDNQDTFFLNPQEAYRVASEQNRWGDDDDYLQICYYDGEKIDSEFSNLIHLSLDNLVDELAQGTYRIPSKIDFTGLDISSDIKLDVLVNFNLSIQHAQNYRNQYNNYYLENLRNSKLDFNEPLRFYLAANTDTQVMQHVAKNISDVLTDKGCEVMFDLRTNTEDNGCFKKLLQFNPHVTININHLNNLHISDEVFNIVWFQDPMPILMDESKISLRDRDSVFHLIKHFGEMLEGKGVESKYQPFCINTDTYKSRPDVQREKKIVYIGNSYNYLVNSKLDSQICNDLIKVYDNNSIVSEEDVEQIANKYSVSASGVNNILAYVEKDILIIKLALLNTKYKFEIYGSGWERYEELKSNYKGRLNYGEDISKVYNSATYAFVTGSYVMQQRTLEAAASGAIPIVYDSRFKSQTQDEEYFDDSLVFFRSMDELQSILNSDEVQERDLSKIVEANSYENFVQEILEILKKEKVSI